ncbi:MAG TPA: flavin reductase [Bacteroidetes bacterium]|nr:flavin reductase [Bacteroidota bacterium]
MTDIVSYNPYDLPIRDRHRLLTGAVGPRPICWASTLSKEGNANLAPYSFFNLFSSNPPIIVFSSNRRGRDNTTKDTYHNLKDNGEVVVNIVSYDLVHQMNISSTDYAENINEFSKAGVTPIASEVVKPFRVKEAKVQLECIVEDTKHLGNEGGAGTLFICAIKKIHIHASILAEDGLIDAQKIDLIGRLGRNDYVRASGDAIFSINNPFEKQNLGFDSLPKGLVESKLLTGAELAQLAMEIKLPSEEDLLNHQKETPVNEEKLHQIIREKIKKGDYQSSLALAVNFYKR